MWHNHLPKLITASQSGGWAPETSRSFHYWQPAPRWRPLPWLAKEKGGTGEGDSLQGVPTLRSNANAIYVNADWNDWNAIQMLQCPMDKEHEESWRMSIYNKPLTALVKLVLLVVNSVKLHLITAGQSGGWVPETSRSFHYWQPPPWWRLLPWLANPGNPAMSPHAKPE